MGLLDKFKTQEKESNKIKRRNAGIAIGLITGIFLGVLIAK